MITKYLSILLLILFFQPVVVFAQVDRTLPTYNADVDKTIGEYLCTPTGSGSDLVDCVNKMYRFGIAAGAILLVLFLVIAGYLYITGSEAGKGKAKLIIMNTVVGMGLLLGSYVILYFINPSLVAFKPIQPPIFKAGDLPSCQEVGFGEACVGVDGGVSVGGGTCAMPIADSAIIGFNNSMHTDNKSGHGPLSKDSPSPAGIVDLKIDPKATVPVYSPITGRVAQRRGPLGQTGEWIQITTDVTPGAVMCGNGSGCANLAHISPSVNEGDRVQAGQQVGTVKLYSCSGCFGPHLHLELKLNGQWIMGDGFKGTWENMKTAIAKCANQSNSSSQSLAGEPKDLVDAKSLVPELVIDMQYASANPSSNNFMKTAFYTGKYAKYGQGCYLSKSTAEKLKKAQDSLPKGYKIKAWDCYRPQEVQKLMRDWGDKQVPRLGNDKIASPGGSKHNSGSAIDATLVGPDGKDLDMPSIFDDFTNSDPAKISKSSQKYKNYQILYDVMKSAGFSRASTEWWHYH